MRGPVVRSCKCKAWHIAKDIRALSLVRVPARQAAHVRGAGHGVRGRLLDEIGLNFLDRQFYGGKARLADKIIESKDLTRTRKRDRR